MSALGVLVAPAVAARELVAAVRVLPDMAAELGRVRVALERMNDTLDQVQTDASVLPEVREQLAAVSAQTAQLHAIEEGMARIAAIMPELHEVRGILTPLPGTIDRLIPALEQLYETTSGLGGTVATLSEAVSPLGRIADRIPRGRRLTDSPS